MSNVVPIYVIHSNMKHEQNQYDAKIIFTCVKVLPQKQHSEGWVQWDTLAITELQRQRQERPILEAALLASNSKVLSQNNDKGRNKAKQQQ